MQVSESTNTTSPSPPSSPPVDLRHMTSNSGLSPNSPTKPSSRTSQHLQTTTITGGSLRLGSRSPNSIPSSPTSVHSSSSAIFERDIEPICPSPPHPSHAHPHHAPNPHRIPRSKATEHLDQSVPSVLDSAAAILTASSPDDDDRISVVAPARDVGSRSGVTSPIGSLRSRSPSPSRQRTSLLLSIPAGVASPPPSSVVSVPGNTSPAPTRPTIQTSITASSTSTASTGPVPPGGYAPSISTPTSAYYSTISSADSSPTTTTLEHPPSLPGPTPTSAYPQQPHLSPQPTAQLGLSTTTSHPPSPTTHPSKRLSFMSYTDLLASTPASLRPLSALTSSASSVEPPPHIPSVAGFPQAAASVHGGMGAGGMEGVGMEGMGVGMGGYGGRGRNRDSVALTIDGDVGGEWEREGLGRGLEERLEALMSVVGVPGKA